MQAHTYTALLGIGRFNPPFAHHISMPKHTESLGPVLVIGGCGFMGHHLVRTLLDDSSVAAVHVFSRNPRENRYAEATYHAGDIASREEVQSLLSNIQPRVIFHTVSADPFGDPPNYKAFQHVNVDGTANLLACAAKAPSVAAFVYTSSMTIYVHNSNGECVYAHEESPVYQGPVTADKPYHHSKALADAMVLAADDSRGVRNPDNSHRNRLRTACVRLPAIYGEGDKYMTLMTMRVVRAGVSSLQMGYNTTLYHPIYVKNAVYGHIVTAKALLKEIESPQSFGSNMKVHGEAFNFTDDSPRPFFDYLHAFYAIGGSVQSQKTVWKFPNWLVMASVFVVEWIYWVVFRGQRRPEILTREKLEFVCKTRTYSAEKAEKRLGWKAPYPVDKAIEDSALWALKELRMMERIGKN